MRNRYVWLKNGIKLGLLVISHVLLLHPLHDGCGSHGADVGYMLQPLPGQSDISPNIIHA